MGEKYIKFTENGVSIDNLETTPATAQECINIPQSYLEYSFINGNCIDIMKINWPASVIEDKTAKTVIDTDVHGNYRLSTYKDGLLQGYRAIMPSVKDMTLYNNNTLVIKFSDDTEEKATLQDGDTFDIEQAISICMMKRLIAYHWNCSGSSVYNKLIDLGVTAWNNKQKQIEEQKKTDEEEKARQEKRIEKVKRRKEKRRAKAEAERRAETERLIEIQKEAYIRAMREITSESDASSEM